MSKIEIKYIHKFKDRHGKTRIYFRRAGYASTALPGPPGSKEFLRAYQQALAGVTAPALIIGSGRSSPKSISSLIAAYYGSPEFAQLADQTKQTYRGTLERFRRDHGHLPVAGLEPHHVRKIVSTASTPVAANHLLMRIHTIMVYAVEHDWRKDDPTVGIRKLKVKTLGHHTWTEEEISQFEAKWPVGTRERLAFDLLLFTAQRSSDVRQLGAKNLVQGRIELRQQKTGTFLSIPIVPRLQRSFDATPLGPTTFLVSSAGKPFTAAGFSNWTRDIIREAGLKRGISAHGLRKAAARRLAEAGCTAHEIMSITGHTTLKEVERYTRAADRSRLSDDAMRKMTNI